MLINDCPRCTHPMSRHPALSRADDKTSVCSNCGLEEAIEIFSQGKCTKLDEWPLVPKQHKFLWTGPC